MKTFKYILKRIKSFFTVTGRTSSGWFKFKSNNHWYMLTSIYDYKKKTAVHHVDTLVFNNFSEWSKALTPEEVQVLYNSGIGLKYKELDKKHLLQFWPLVEIRGTRVASDGAEIHPIKKD